LLLFNSSTLLRRLFLRNASLMLFFIASQSLGLQSFPFLFRTLLFLNGFLLLSYKILAALRLPLYSVLPVVEVTVSVLIDR
jgi:hypothetical protein